MRMRPSRNGGRRIDGAMVGDQPRVFEQVNENGRRTLFNEDVPKRVMSPTQAAILNSILQKVVRHGTGTRAALPDRAVAGKTGTTENYADAWFVGYTPQLVVAIWVGYPESSKSMLTEFHGEPVTGGSFPALIWKSFAEKALKDRPTQYFPYPLVPYASTKSSSAEATGCCWTTAPAARPARWPTSPGWARQGRRTAGRTRSRCPMCGG